jgi:hypothetical protein
LNHKPVRYKVFSWFAFNVNVLHRYNSLLSHIQRLVYRYVPDLMKPPDASVAAPGWLAPLISLAEEAGEDAPVVGYGIMGATGVIFTLFLAVAGLGGGVYKCALFFLMNGCALFYYKDFLPPDVAWKQMNSCYPGFFKTLRSQMQLVPLRRGFFAPFVLGGCGYAIWQASPYLSAISSKVRGGCTS